MIYVCEKCKLEFTTEKECMRHEEICGEIDRFVCNKCGKIIEWEVGDLHEFSIKNACHKIDLGTMGYGSRLDGSRVAFSLCDDCLIELIDSFVYNDKIIS